MKQYSGVLTDHLFDGRGYCAAIVLHMPHAADNGSGFLPAENFPLLTWVNLRGCRS